MQYVEGFPKTMVHPSSQPARLSMDIAATANSPGYSAPPGTPARYLPETVHSPEQEADMRARGYLDVGEPPAQVHYAEYPKILRHPGYSPAVKASQKSVVVRSTVDGQIQEEIKIVPVPAVEEQFPDKIVATAEEEERWRNEGWAPAGEWDSAAFERAHSTPEVDYDPQEWPKWVPTGEVDKDGKPIAVLMEDPNAVPAAELARQAHEYPKWVNGRKVASAAEEVLAKGDAAVVDSIASAAPDVVNYTAAFPKVVNYIPPGTEASLQDVLLARQAQQLALDVATMKAEILHELVPQIRDVIREALAPQPGGPAQQVPYRSRERIDTREGTDKPRRVLSAEQRKAIGERLKAARAAKRAAVSASQ